MAFDCVDSRFLKVRPWLISVDPRQIELLQNCRNIVVLKFDRAVAAINLTHQYSSMLSFVVGFLTYFGVPHGEIVGDDEIKLSVSPVSPLFGLFCHFLLSCYDRHINLLRVVLRRNMLRPESADLT